MIAPVGESISGMPGAPFGPEVADHHDVAGDDAAGEDGRQGVLLAVEHARRTDEALAFLAGDLGDGAGRRQVALQDHQVAVGLDGGVQRPHDRLPLGVGRDLRQVLGQRPPADRQALAMQQARVQQRLHQGPDAADRDQLGHQVLAARPEVREHRHPLADRG
jgi:hypothetical protein